MKVAVLGCGPAGLMAAHAVKLQTGNVPAIFSKKVKSEMFGAMYLHRPIPGITPGTRQPEFTVNVSKVGRRSGYAQLVYGNASAPVSWDDIREGPNPAWNLRAAYNKLWQMYADYIIDTGEIRANLLDDILARHPIVFSTIPAKSICQEEHHEWVGQKIWVKHGKIQPDFEKLALESVMYYNGYPPDGSEDGIKGYAWYRYSRILGYEAWEYTTVPTWNVDDPRYQNEGIKPISTDCDCWPDIQRLGRFGKWKKGVLTHHAFEEAETRMVKALEPGVL